MRCACAWASSGEPSPRLPWLLLIFPPHLAPFWPPEMPTVILTRGDPHTAKEGVLTGLSLADRHLLLGTPSPAFPSKSRQPVSASVQAQEGQERRKAGAGGQGRSGLPSPGLPEHPSSSSEDRLVPHTAHFASLLPGVRQSGQTGRASSSGPVSWAASLQGLEAVLLGSSSPWA